MLGQCSHCLHQGLDRCGLSWEGSPPGPAKTWNLGGALNCHLLRGILKGLDYSHSDRDPQRHHSRRREQGSVQLPASEGPGRSRGHLGGTPSSLALGSSSRWPRTSRGHLSHQTGPRKHLCPELQPMTVLSDPQHNLSPTQKNILALIEIRTSSGLRSIAKELAKREMIAYPGLLPYRGAQR